MRMYAGQRRKALLPVGLYLVVFLTIAVYNRDSAVHATDAKVRYIHLALTGDPSEMNVGWYTEEATNQSVVEYGPNPNPPFPFKSQGSANQWLKGYGWNHFATAIHLKPSTIYYYRCGDPSTGEWSDVLQFKTQPAATDAPFTVAVYGDMGIVHSKDTANRINDHAKKGDFDFVYHIGDISYADDHFLWFHQTWNTWFEMMEPTTSSKPYMVLPGNHEYCSFNPLLFFQTKDFVVFNKRFMMPGAASSVGKNMYYSFDYGNVHFITYSTESSFPDAPFSSEQYGDQLQWLEQDLRQANTPENRAQRPWIIVSGHRPIYSSSHGYSKNGVPLDNWEPPANSLTLQRTFEELFAKYRVDILLSGHVHSYERNFPAYQSKRMGGYTEPRYPIGIVIGNAGNLEGLEDGKEDDWTHPQPEWSAFRYGQGYGYGLLQVHNRTHLDWTFYSAADGSVLDSVTVVNHGHLKPPMM